MNHIKYIRMCTLYAAFTPSVVNCRIMQQKCDTEFPPRRITVIYADRKYLGSVRGENTPEVGFMSQQLKASHFYQIEIRGRKAAFQSS